MAFRFGRRRGPVADGPVADGPVADESAVGVGSACHSAW
jgi:hypothetical protein